MWIIGASGKSPRDRTYVYEAWWGPSGKAEPLPLLYTPREFPEDLADAPIIAKLHTRRYPIVLYSRKLKDCIV